MATELEELNSRLDQLEARLPSIMAMSEGPSEFWASFMKEAEGIEEEAGAYDEHVFQRLQTMLRAYGMSIASVG